MGAAQMIASLLTDVRDPDITREVIVQHARDLMPLAAMLLNSQRQRLTADQEFKWATSSLLGRATAINNVADDYDDETTSMVVDDGAVFAPNTLIRFEATGEVGLVTAVSTHTLTVARGIGAVAAADASVADNAVVVNIGYAGGEGGNTPAANQAAPTIVSNYVQTFRKAVKLSGRVQRMRTKSEDEQLRQRALKLEEITFDIEHMLLFGAKSTANADAAGDNVTTSAGFYDIIATNVVDISGAMTMDNLRAGLIQIFEQGSRQKIGLCGTSFLSWVHKLHDNKLNVTPTDQAGGLSLTRVIHPGGELVLTPHYGLTGARAAECLVVDPAEAELRYTEDADMAENTGRLHLREDVGTDGADAQTDEWFAEMGLEYGNEAAHGVIIGATAPA